MDLMSLPNVRIALRGGRGEVKMASYMLRLSPREVIRVVRAELMTTGGAPELYLDAWSDFLIEEDFDRAAYGLRDDTQHDLVTSEAVLNIEPRLERNYWVLSIIAHRVIGPQIIGDENSYIGEPLSLDEFEGRFVAADPGRAVVRLATETPAAKAHFDAWWAEIAARHPRETIKEKGTMSATVPSAPKPTQPQSVPTPAEGNWTYTVREAVAVFADADAWEEAVMDLEMSGFDRAAISVLGSTEDVKARVGHRYNSITEAEDDPRAPRSAFVSRGSRLEGEASAITFPFFIAGLTGAWAVVASGGALAAAVAAMLLGSVGGAGLGGLLARTIARHHHQTVAEQLALGGLVLWVSVPNARAEARALEVLRRRGGRHVHVHETMREWGPRQRPLSDEQVDPLLLERDPA